MYVITLSDAVRNRIKGYLQDFKKFLQSDEGRAYLDERIERSKKFRELLSMESIDNLTISDFKWIISSLWAYSGWTNKDYLVENRILEQSDFNTIKSELKNLLHSTEPFPKRFDAFSKRVKGLGPSGLTEILAFTQPSKYGIWNDRSRRALEILGLKDIVPTGKYRISGEEYERFNEISKLIFYEIKDKAEEPDLLFTDIFLYYVWKKSACEYITPMVKSFEFDHDEVVEMLVQLGSGLGFDAESEVDIAKGARVDVVWRARIANLGVVSYVFEVHRRGSIDSLILNLQKAKNNPTVQKLVVVSNSEELEKIKEEVSPLSEDFKKSLAYFEVEEVYRASELLRELNTIIGKLELVKSF